MVKDVKAIKEHLERITHKFRMNMENPIRLMLNFLKKQYWKLITFWKIYAVKD